MLSTDTIVPIQSSLRPLILRDRETWFTFVCAVCRKPIAPPENGNVVWNDPDPYITMPLEPFEDAGKVELLDAPVYVVHKKCDLHGRLGRCWTPLSAVLSLNQNIFEKFRQGREYAEFQRWRTRKQRRERAKLLHEFDKLCEVEPQLRILFEEVKAIRDDGKNESFCANTTWSQRFKSRLAELVGWHRKDDALLGTSRSYDIAFDAVYQELPGCRNCGCL